MRTHILYAYQTQTICVPEQVVCISSMSDMCTINVYAYRTRTICIPEHVVCISDTDDMRTHSFVRISSMSNMHTRAGSMHIGHRRYVYTFICTHIVHVQYAHQSRWYTYRTQMICIPEQVVRISSMSDMRTINVYAY